MPLRPAEKPSLDLRGKLYLAPLTTVGNLPFRCQAQLFALSGDMVAKSAVLCNYIVQCICQQRQTSPWKLLCRVNVSYAWRRSGLMRGKNQSMWESQVLMYVE